MALPLGELAAQPPERETWLSLCLLLPFERACKALSVTFGDSSPRRGEPIPRGGQDLLFGEEADEAVSHGGSVFRGAHEFVTVEVGHLAFGGDDVSGGTVGLTEIGVA